MLEELSEGDRQIVQMETVKLAEMIFMIEYNFNDVERRLQKVDTIKIIRVNLKLEMCSPDWIKLHHVRLIFPTVSLLILLPLLRNTLHSSTIPNAVRTKSNQGSEVYSFYELRFTY